MASSLLGRREPRQPAAAANEPAAGNEPAEGRAGLAEIAFDFLFRPINIYRRATNGGNLGDGSGQNNAGNNDISRLSLHYSSANLSEEESSSLINILDRKKYHERLAATRSAEE